jgi:hypothetical protein
LAGLVAQQAVQQSGDGPDGVGELAGGGPAVRIRIHAGRRPRISSSKAQQPVPRGE